MMMASRIDTNPPTSAADAPQLLDVAFGGYSSAGLKAENQDAFAVYQPEGSARQLKGCVACIADGVSCSDNAQQASQTAVTTFIDDYLSTPDTWPVKTAAARVLSSLNAWLHHHGQQRGARHDGLMTTFSAVVVKSTTAHVFHVGDSRVYRYRRGELEQLTHDHCCHQAPGDAVLTRALGLDSHLEVDYCQEDLEAGDLLFLSTDGVHDTLGTCELKAILERAPKPGGKSQFPGNALETLAQELVEAAQSKGSADNLSCLLLQVNQLPEEDINEIHRKLTQRAIPPVMEPGMILDGYEVLRVIHSGTRSHLYLVHRPGEYEQFVLKAPSLNFAEDPQYLEGFIREQWIGRRINHRAVMNIHPRDLESPFLYHLCEYIDGQTLRQWMYDNPDPDFETVREIARQMVVSVRALQRLGMVHRDLKPENFLIDRRGRVKLIDFGTVQVGSLAEIHSPLGESCPVGSVDYIAPEYLLGERGTHCSDIFSLGVIVYEMLTGRLPFKVSAIPQASRRHFEQWCYYSAQRARQGIPPWLDLALKKATSPAPQRRYAAMSEFIRDLSVPNQSMVDSLEAAPLLERNPIRFWKLATLVLMSVVIVQAVLLGDSGH
jgi:serine/threonine protein phosphatase PrpC/predicted Ser/Thr protein kinase